MSFKRGDTVSIKKEFLRKIPNANWYKNTCFVTFARKSNSTLHLGGNSTLHLGDKESYISRGIGYFRAFSSSNLIIKKRLLTERIKIT